MPRAVADAVTRKELLLDCGVYSRDILITRSCCESVIEQTVGASSAESENSTLYPWAHMADLHHSRSVTLGTPCAWYLVEEGTDMLCASPGEAGVI